MAHRTPQQLACRRRIERLIWLAAPALDLLLFAGHHLSRLTGGDDPDPDLPRRSAARGGVRAPLGR